MSVQEAPISKLIMSPTADAAGYSFVVLGSVLLAQLKRSQVQGLKEVV